MQPCDQYAYLNPAGKIKEREKVREYFSIHVFRYIETGLRAKLCNVQHKISEIFDLTDLFQFFCLIIS